MDPTPLPTNDDLTQDPRGELIAAARVQGSSVYGQDQQHIGVIEDVMIDKRSGHVAYAVLSFGGFLGLGSKHFPLPWRLLKYEPLLPGYVVELTRERLDRAPTRDASGTADWASVDQYWAA
ncbi:MAG: PRC-barrel domain-containing protein [Acetobacteraceae bacterium]|nr:PRC-barrel domain-containing protein [Acetobacteraceae bacterium]